ncbi:MAG: alpha-mannosidase [Anaerolineaceae bacterium]|jgi:alpha-mannosidase|nr:alpha-mannosidase [Anaerolineaceae bacterium]
MKNKKLHMIGNAHIDPVWLWQWQEGFHEVKASFRSALDRMNEFDDFIFVSSSAVFYEWVQQSDPAMFAEIKQRVKEGRWGIVGGWWIEPDCNIPSGESFVRHGLYSQRYFLKNFGVTAKTGFNVDSFGHAASLPQILKKSGIENYVFLRPMPHEKNLPARLFWWESDDGSRVLTFRIPFEYLSWGKDVRMHAERCMDELKEPIDQIMCFYGVGNHGGGPTIENIESLHLLDQEKAFPAQLVCSTPDAYFQVARQADWPIPVVHDELQYHASGCYAVHSGIKRWNRSAENRLQAAEKWSSAAAWVLNRTYPTDFEHAWKQVLFNQFHDIMAGTSLEEAYEDARNAMGEAISIADRNLNQALQAFAWKIAIPQEEKTRPLVVFNPHAWPVQSNIEMEASNWPDSAVLVDDQGHLVAHQRLQSSTITGRARLSFNADLPALGYRTYTLVLEGKNVPSFEMVKASDQILSNGRYRLEIDETTGNITSLRDLTLDLEVFSGDAARAVVLDDPSDTWGHNYYSWNNEIGDFKASDVRLIEHGPVKSVIQVVSHYENSTLIQRFCMYPDRDQIDVTVTVDWHENYKMLKLRFPVNVKFMKVTRDVGYGISETFANGQEYPFQQWVDVSGTSRDKDVSYGFSLLNDGKYSLDVNVRDIGLTVLRSPAYAHHIPAQPQPGRFYRYIDQGLQTFHISLLPHQGSWESSQTVQRAVELNQKPSALFATFHPDGDLPLSDSFISVLSSSVLITTLKQAEEGDDLIIRAVETQKTQADCVIKLPHWQRTITAQFGPSEIKTFRVPKDPSLQVVETNLLEKEMADAA